MTPDIRLIQTQRPELDMMLLNDIKQVIMQKTPFYEFNEKELYDYLDHVNSLLKEGKSGHDKHSKQEIREHYITAASIYTFAVPLLNMNVPADTGKNFSNILRQDYGWKEPFSVYFKHNDGEYDWWDHNEEFVQIDRETEMENLAINGKRSVLGKVESELSEVCNRLDGEYTRRDHFSFVGFYDICPHLFKLKFKEKNEVRYSRMDASLEENYGSFEFKIPEELQ